jgi:predicted helicase
MARNRPSTPPPVAATAELARAKPLRRRDTAHVESTPANDIKIAGLSPLKELLDTYRQAAVTNREAGTYFEELTLAYLKTEPVYKELYRDVSSYAAWAERSGLDKRDAGIDLVAETFTGEVHAIQCKLYPADYRVKKGDIDSFFTASGKKPFSRRLIFATTDTWSEHAEDALRDQQPPVTKIDLNALEQSIIDWAAFKPKKVPTVRAKKLARPHQMTACEAVLQGLQTGTRGKLIMACGTGKTFTSLKIAETLAGGGKRVLFLVPSLALLSQTLTEWTQESAVRLRNFAVCSDSDVGKKRKKNDDTVQTFVHELQYPATTDAAILAREAKKLHDAAHMTVVYATYHSIGVVHEAQTEHGLPAFDLIVCDEAHRTTGANLEGMDESPFVRVHDAAYIKGKKRVYMTATPRIYGEVAKAAAERGNVALASMDDEVLYGPTFYRLTFSEAVKRDLLVDYKVIILSVDERHVSDRLQNLLKDENNQLRLDDAAKIVGCWKALTKQGLAESLSTDERPMKRAVAFCQVIERQIGSRSHKVSSKHIAEMFQAVVEAYQESEPREDDAALRLVCEAKHVDGSMNASEKEAKIAWLKADTPDGACRILSNVRCLSEGVDVPALDAVLFLTPRSSQIDVVQSVGRVMRKSPGKKRGYIVLPVAIPAQMDPEQALNDNEIYRVVWQVLQALRSHDDRFDAIINKLSLIGKEPSKLEVVAVANNIGNTQGRADSGDWRVNVARRARTGCNIGVEPPAAVPEQHELNFEIGEMERAIYARLVDKVGNRRHWEDWANDIAKIASTHITRIHSILENRKNTDEREAFQQFSRELRNDLNDQITEDEVVEMLAQHLVTKPVFDALFEGHDFVSQNPMSRAMQGVLDALQKHHLEKEASTLEAFYESVKLRAEGIDSAEGKQRIVVELYDKFFHNAFPKMSERLGIVYTPVQIVDFILKSVDHLLRTEFGQTLGSEGVHILDPFTGTGTFITRLMQSGLLSKEELSRKYKREIHANEIVLLAYYIAAINIELAYHSVVGGEYAPFDGICLADTFQLNEKDDLGSKVLAENSARRKRQKGLDIRVIISNPPYSVGQESQNDNNQNVNYPQLDDRIANTYAARSNAVLKNAIYDSYVRAIRWASDRVGKSGIIGFVTNASFVEANTADGLRRCLADEFSSLYVFHLRGNQRTSGERSRKEGGKVFGSGSRAPVAISLLVKNPNVNERGRIFFRDVGDYLSREQKLEAVANFGSVLGISEVDGWTSITPDEHGDWLRQRDVGFSRHIVLGNKKGGEAALFAHYSNGVKTNRDAWAYGYSRRAVAENMSRTIAFYNSEVSRFDSAHGKLAKRDRKARVARFIDTDPQRIAWDRAQRLGVANGRRGDFSERRIVPSLYRPYTKQWLYFDQFFNNCVYKMPSIFPAGSENRVIGVSAGESRSDYSVLMADVVPSLHATDMIGSQFFPLFVYDAGISNEDDDSSKGSSSKKKRPKAALPPARRESITDAGLANFRRAYPKETITKEDVFYYVYGILHSPDYRARYADNLGKELPRIPRVRSAAQFWSFCRAGRALGDLHVGYEHVAEFAGVDLEGPRKPTRAQYRVEKMKFGSSAGGGKDKTVILYNAIFTVRGIPLEAYEYVVNGKSAIEWVMERQSITTDKDSGIVKDANAWAIETAEDPRYPLSVLLRVITVSLETMRVVRGLPQLEVLD